MPAHLWKYMRLRPAAFPDIRISQLAHLLSKVDFLFSKILEIDNLQQLEKLFHTQASEFWNKHYRFGVPSPPKIKKMGHSSLNTLFINAVIPFLFVYGKRKGETSYQNRALDFLSQIKAEQNQITKKFSSLGKNPLNALQSQAQIELKQHYCDFKKCLDCKIGMMMMGR